MKSIYITILDIIVHKKKMCVNMRILFCEYEPLNVFKFICKLLIIILPFWQITKNNNNNNNKKECPMIGVYCGANY